MNDLVAGELRIEVSQGGGDALRLFWRGKSGDRRPADAIGPFLREAVDAASVSGAPLELHFEALAHMNSSSINCVVQLIRAARERKVRLVLVYDPVVAWQRLSFEALRVFEKPDGLLTLRAGAS
jgi:hypothetical protein